MEGACRADMVPVPDAETAPLMIEFHRLLATGVPATPALAQAQKHLGDSHPAAMAAAAGFVSIGTGAVLSAPAELPKVEALEQREHPAQDGPGVPRQAGSRPLTS